MKLSRFLILFLLAACSPVVQKHVAVTRQPSMLRDHLVTGAGHVLPLRYWEPEGTPEAVIIALHGFNDYSNAFTGAGYYFSKRGIVFYAYDQRGFGRTNYQGIWGGKENLEQDLAQMVQAALMKYPGIPVYLLGESMGGAVVISALADHTVNGVQGAILSAPAVWGSDTMNSFYRSMLWLMAHTMPGATVTGEGVRILASDNINMLRAMGRDPLVIKKTRIDAIYGIVGLMDYAYANVNKVEIPMLMLYGARDQVIPRKSVEKVIGRFNAPYRVAYYPEGYHMLLRDLKGEIVLNDIVSWIKYAERPLPSGYDQEWRKRMSLPPGSSLLSQ